MDPLAEIVSSMNVRKALFDRVEVTAPWGFHSTCGPEIKFALILRGAGILKTRSLPAPLSLSGGDVFIMFDDSEYSISDSLRSKLIDCSALKDLKIGDTIQFGGGGSPTTLIVGRFEIDPMDAKPILKALPSFLHLHLNQNRTHSFQSVLELLSLETEQPGLASEAMINRLCELLFIHAIRAHTLENHQGNSGWLAGIADRQLGKTILSVHNQLRKGWTVDSMAASAGMSRSAFAARFKVIVGQSPLEYLTQWRMHKASTLIRRNNSNMSEVAHAVGYESESAFTKIFKKQTGITPSEFRRVQIASNLQIKDRS
jgi:AraC-like DNA-binding protein